jgi:hypothetical protein
MMNAQPKQPGGKEADMPTVTESADVLNRDELDLMRAALLYAGTQAFLDGRYEATCDMMALQIKLARMSDSGGTVVVTPF